jgi:hypothetical protein
MRFRLRLFLGQCKKNGNEILMSEQQSGNPMVSRVVEIDLKIPRVIIN